MESVDYSKYKMFIVWVYLLIALVKVVYSIVSTQGDNNYTLYAIIALIVNSIIAYFVYRNNKIATMIMSLLILLTGISALMLGLVMSFNQPYFKIFSIVAGILFCCGAITLYSCQKKERA
jgi:hypothetical protein